jgi:hypothetical protein
MTTRQRTFVLPPNFLFPPEGRIKPGIVLRDGKHDAPDPSLPLHDGSASIEGAEITSLDEGFHYEGNNRVNTKLGLWLDALSLVEVGLGGERGNSFDLKIDSVRAIITRFGAGDAYVARLMADPVLREYTKRPRCRPVYLITGVMVAEDATVEVRAGCTSVYKAKVMVNGEGCGVPVKVGPDFERDSGETWASTSRYVKPFVLAYELQRIRRKWSGTVGSQSHNRHALWDAQAAETREEWEIVPYEEDEGAVVRE